jgi:hypothetical protein
MTIKVEQEALLRVLQRQPCHPPSCDPIGSEQEYVIVNFCQPLSSDAYCVKTLLRSTSDDEDSVFTLSTASLSSDDSSECEAPKRVTFADPLVTEVWTRPYTEKDSGLYYSVGKFLHVSSSTSTMVLHGQLASYLCSKRRYFFIDHHLFTHCCLSFNIYTNSSVFLFNRGNSQVPSRVSS